MRGGTASFQCQILPVLLRPCWRIGLLLTALSLVLIAVILLELHWPKAGSTAVVIDCSGTLNEREAALCMTVFKIQGDLKQVSSEH